MANKKAGRISPDMPIKFARMRFVYEGKGPDYPIYGLWYDLDKVIRNDLYPNQDYRLMWIEFETKEVPR